MAIESIANFHPKIHESAFIAASADVIGRVTIHEEASVWYNATLRGDINEITVGPRSNIQDNAVIHLADDFGCHVGKLVTVGHSAGGHLAAATATLLPVLLVVSLALSALVGMAVVATRLGSEFLPKLDEGNIWLTITLPPATGLATTLSRLSRA